MRFKPAIAFAGFALFASHAAAQVTSLEGEVKGGDGKPVTNAILKFIRLDATRTYEAKTDKRGRYFYIGLPVGVYTVMVQVEGKDAAAVTGVRTKPGNPLPVSFDLRESRQQQQQRIMHEVAEMGGDAEFIKAIPMQAGPAPPANRELTADQKEAADKQMADRAAAIKQRDDLNNAFTAGLNALEAGRYEEAVAALSKAAEVDPKEQVVWGNLASAYVRLAGTKTGAEFDAAIQKSLEIYVKAIALKPNDALTHSNYALALAKARKFSEMQTELKKVAELDPANAWHSYYNSGATLTNAGQSEAALEAFRMAIAAAPEEPQNAESYYQYAVALVSKAQIGADGKVTPVAGTAEAFQKYLQLAPGGPNAQSAKEMLATLGSSVGTSFTNPGTTKK